MEEQQMAYWNLVVSLASLSVSVITSVFVGYMTFVMLRFSAKPKLRINLVGSEADIAFLPERLITLRIHLENVGHWYAKPAATSTKLYWNFHADFEPKQLRFGSYLERTDANVRKGKGASKYLRAEGIHLTAGEPGEYVEADVKTPSRPGVYPTRVSAFCEEGDCGIHEFTIKISEPAS